MKRLFVGLLTLALLAGCSTGKDAVSQGDTFEFVAPGGKTDIVYDVGDRKHVPNLSGDDLMNEGKQLSLADFTGKVVVVNIWGQWCAPCRTESPEMEKLYQANQAKGVQVLGYDVRDYDRSAPQDFMRDRGLTYPSLYDPAGRGLLKLSGYPLNAVPSTIVIDKQQRVAAVYLRTLLASDLQPLVQQLAAE
ncbi:MULTISPECIES: TlpA disulfide reductase family protein [Amycolatopsis]|uniref:Thiol-disulfide isomerase or thioredoxin n=2 Tax=Amycolatopsis TaxID=1813 RepID=A0A1I4CP43_9PSEU|nr:TlpA disulfide reductase family protein [Amycolatopsis sacchari]SFK83044.1 Thiol-disulfide isomerase or thioredoxin [Amycolatopsis sacchari]